MESTDKELITYLEDGDDKYFILHEHLCGE